MKYNIEIYMEIVAWFTLQYTNSSPLISKDELTIEIDSDIYANVHYNSEGDIDISHYQDEECEIDIDGGGVVEMEDFHSTIEDSSRIIDQEDMDSLNKEIAAKCEFIYELCFTL